jgi:hypothetical protein
MTFSTLPFLTDGRADQCFTMQTQILGGMASGDPRTRPCFPVIQHVHGRRGHAAQTPRIETLIGLPDGGNVDSAGRLFVCSIWRGNSFLAEGSPFTRGTGP